MGQLYDLGWEVSIFGSHSPDDEEFRQDLMESVIGDWDVNIHGRSRHFRISYTITFDEPVDGLMNGLITEDGQHSQYTDIMRWTSERLSREPPHVLSKRSVSI